MKKQSGLSTVEVEVLEFWENVLPIDLIRPHKRLLPESAKLPKRSASDSEWLGFYESISTPQIRDSVELVSVLSYPILDARDLAGQLAGKDRALDDSHKYLISSLNASDFPLKGISATLMPILSRSLSESFRGCAQAYDQCRADAENDREQERCEFAYHKCSSIWELQIFHIYIKELLPGLFPPIPQPPWSLRRVPD
jgi:hypothetical protein